ncbi:hypothetical protein [Streptomyces sp. NPDC050485]|uniref:hypothetical protein n=1 Tax=Streptomyces sp. NPDC050485 TaxID=3365617 RepID=UPI0037955027
MARSQKVEGCRTGEFLVEADAEMHLFISEIADRMAADCGISRAEAVARVNQVWRGTRFDPYPDLICHESDEYWALGIYYGEVPSWAEDADRSAWRAVPAPPSDSPCWTLPPEV